MKPVAIDSNAMALRCLPTLVAFCSLAAFCSEAGLASPFMRERDRAHNDSRVIWGPAEGDATLKNATLLRCL